jgi:hypothetical protein
MDVVLTESDSPSRQGIRNALAPSDVVCGWEGTLDEPSLRYGGVSVQF